MSEWLNLVNKIIHLRFNGTIIQKQLVPIMTQEFKIASAGYSDISKLYYLVFCETEQAHSQGVFNDKDGKMYPQSFFDFKGIETIEA
jgi:hypothetical protein